MLDILLFLLYFPRFFFSLVTTVIVSYMLSACKGSEKIETRPPPNLRVWMTPPPPPIPLSEGLNPPLAPMRLSTSP